MTFYSKALEPNQRIGLPRDVTHAVYQADDGLAHLVALCLSASEAERVRDALIAQNNTQSR